MTLDEDFNHFMDCLTEAGIRIESHYFQLHVAGSENPIFRERVYCYELYHQLRCILGNRFHYKLDGEVDKNGHPIIRGGKKPDFIVHQPGNMERNLVVIEVKPITVENEIRKLNKDIDTLRKFLNFKKGRYHRGIILIYGDGHRDLPERIISEVENSIGNNRNRILLFWHHGPGIRPEIVQVRR